MPNSPVLAIVLNYHGGAMTEKCLRSLRQGTVVPDILIVDNASTDASLAKLGERFPGIEVIRNVTNLGFAGGMNVGLRAALARGYRYAWILNQDATADAVALERLLERAEQYPREGLWSPAIFTPGGTPWFIGGCISFFRMRTTHCDPSGVHASVYPSEYLTGCALLLSRAVLETAGLLDERYFLYYEDAAYSLAARRAGFLPTVVTTARVCHAETSRHSPEKIYWLVRSGLEFFRRETPWYWRWWREVFIRLRRIKNRIELSVAPNPVARSVRQAYTDASTKA